MTAEVERTMTYAEARALTDQIKIGMAYRKRECRPGITKSDKRPHVVYRAHDAEGDILYVGVSLGFAGRMSGHRGSSAWWPLVSRIEIRHCPDRASALALEARWIEMFVPTYNKSAGQR